MNLSTGSSSDSSSSGSKRHKKSKKEKKEKKDKKDRKASEQCPACHACMSPACPHAAWRHDELCCVMHLQHKKDKGKKEDLVRQAKEFLKSQLAAGGGSGACSRVQSTPHTSIPGLYRRSWKATCLHALNQTYPMLTSWCLPVCRTRTIRSSTSSPTPCPSPD